MNVYGSNLAFGDFILYNYGLMLSTFDSSGASDEDIGLSTTTVETFVKDSPVPIYLGETYSEKLKYTMCLIKKPCGNFNRDGDMNFTEYECRSIIRALQAKKGYQWLKIFDDDVFSEVEYRAKVNKIHYEKIAGRVVGILVDIECDSCYAWSHEQTYTVNAKANTPFYVFNNSDDLTSYLLPNCTIKTSESGTLQLINNSDSDWLSELKNISNSETISMDSKNELLSSSNTDRKHILNDFNLHWIRLIPDKNKFTTNMDAKITFSYRAPRKVGFV